jgi:hypothetical protein
MAHTVLKTLVGDNMGAKAEERLVEGSGRNLKLTWTKNKRVVNCGEIGRALFRARSTTLATVTYLPVRSLLFFFPAHLFHRTQKRIQSRWRQLTTSHPRLTTNGD